MTWKSIHDYERDAEEAAEGDAGTVSDRGSEDDIATPPAVLHDQIAEIEVLKEQIAVLEDGLPGAPGMERAALAKEIAAYRAELDSKRQALRQ